MVKDILLDSFSFPSPYQLLHFLTKLPTIYEVLITCYDQNTYKVHNMNNIEKIAQCNAYWIYWAFGIINING